MDFIDEDLGEDRFVEVVVSEEEALHLYKSGFISTTFPSKKVCLNVSVRLKHEPVTKKD